MNYVEARQLLDKQPLPVRPQQAVNVLLRSMDRTEREIDGLLDAMDRGDFDAEGRAVENLRTISEAMKLGREAVGA
ncbi:hypothetical protein LCGC14_1690050 [marine sediment metagenome]|uniref:Uncharacterized protein n=1 Tax=marine sediment metagenome TaxID=412755 RepID=A0A0F9K1P3_9ZZZZ